ncbi:MAG: sorbitol dehydrogenase [Spirochaetaceae bacterium]|nr:MAG: sorbitol dehydrogenase [Spirochaetaceae bacterium]
MRSVAVISPGTVDLVQIPVPEPGPYQVLTRTQVAYICNATDRKLVEGHFPGISADKYPLLLGHENVGIVEAVGEKVRTFKPGDQVIGGLLLDPTDPGYTSGWGGNSDYVLTTDHLAMVADGVADAEHGWDEIFQIMTRVPDDIPAETAGLLCTWREVYGAFSDFQLKPGDDILIFGAGPVGLSFCRFAKLLGLGWVGVVDPLAEKRNRAQACGADRVLAPDEPELADLPAVLGGKLDAVIDAVGQESIINAALPLIKMAGAVCVYGVVGAPAIALQKDRGPYNFNLFVHQWPTRTAEAAAQQPLLRWIRSGKLDAKHFLSGEFAVENINDALAESRKPTAIKTLLRF